MKIQTLILFFLFPLISMAQKKWDDELYVKYTYKTFEQSKLANQTISKDKLDYPLLCAAIFYETNRQRVKYRRKQFIHSKGLEKSAFRYSQDMVEKNFFSHSGKVKGRKKLSERVAYAGIESYGSIGENIAMRFGSNETYLSLAEKFLDQWMHSPGHKRNILDKSFNYMGAGAYFKSNGYVYATQIFSNVAAKGDEE